VGRCQVAIDHHHHYFVRCFATQSIILSKRYPPLPIPPSSKLDLFNRDETLSEKTVHAPAHLDRIMALRATVWDSH
jgi:hypothetical protein